MFTMDDLFEVAVKMEKNAEAVYRNAVEKTGPKNLADLLIWMADEEASHALWFLDQKKRLSLLPEEKTVKEMMPRVLTDMMGEKTLCLDEVPFDEITTAPALLKTFIEFEKETIQFYEVLEIFIKEETVLKGLRKIICEEKSHIEKLTATTDSFC